MISIVSTNFRMSGSYINHLDMQQFLSSYYDVNYYYDDRETPLWEMLLKTKRRYQIQNPIKLKKNIEDDIIITDFRGLYVLTKEGYNLKCNRLIVLDCAELTYHLKNMIEAPNWLFWLDISYNEPLYNYIDFSYNSIEFLMPPSNHKIFRKKYPELKSTVFFKKINIDVMRDDYFKRDIEYGRRPEVLWHEQMGRRVFECLVMGGKVKFINDPFMIEDGLFDYLKHYNIEDQNGFAKVDSEQLRNDMEGGYNFEF